MVSAEQAVETVPEPDIDIWEAAENGDIQALKQHILFGTDLSSKHSNRDNTPLIIAACNGQYEAVKTLLDAGVDINERNVEDVTAQFCAVFFGRTDVVQLLKDDGADFIMPWNEIYLIVIGAYVLTLLATLWPVRKAASILPAEALRDPN